MSSASDPTWRQLSPEAFHATPVERKADFISPASQERLARSTVLAAGCGSTGGASVEPLVRLGVRRLLRPVRVPSPPPRRRAAQDAVPEQRKAAP
jgi:hypothetical protein